MKSKQLVHYTIILHQQSNKNDARNKFMGLNGSVTFVNIGVVHVQEEIFCDKIKNGWMGYRRVSHTSQSI